MPFIVKCYCVVTMEFASREVTCVPLSTVCHSEAKHKCEPIIWFVDAVDLCIYESTAW